MEYKGKELILDNFRNILKDYTVDVQDVVRSAILDGVDISEYIETCSPYKLDQIRLGLKEGLKPIFFSASGELLYQIRRMRREGANISPMEKYLKSTLSDEHLEFILKWVQQGINFSNVNISVIPKSLLMIYDKGLRNGINMDKFMSVATNKSVSSRYIELCVQLEILGIESDFLLNPKYVYPLEVVEFLYKNSDLSYEAWGNIRKYVWYKDSIERVQYLIQMLRNNISIEEWQKTKESGEYLYPTECLGIALEAYKDNINLKELMSENTINGMQDLYAKLKLSKELKVSGRFVKKQKENN